MVAKKDRVLVNTVESVGGPSDMDRPWKIKTLRAYGLPTLYGKPIGECSDRVLWAVLNEKYQRAKQCLAKHSEGSANPLEKEVLATVPFPPVLPASSYPFFPEGVPASVRLEDGCRYADYERCPGED